MEMRCSMILIIFFNMPMHLRTLKRKLDFIHSKAFLMSILIPINLLPLSLFIVFIIPCTMIVFSAMYLPRTKCARNGEIISSSQCRRCIVMILVIIINMKFTYSYRHKILKIFCPKVFKIRTKSAKQLIFTSLSSESCLGCSILRCLSLCSNILVSRVLATRQNP